MKKLVDRISELRSAKTVRTTATTSNIATYSEVFKITYKDPISQITMIATKEFEGTNKFPPSLWADDWAYMAADKGPYNIVFLYRK